MELKELLNQRAEAGRPIVALQKKIADEKREMTADEKALFTRHCADFDVLEEKVKTTKALRAAAAAEEEARGIAQDNLTREERAAAAASFGGGQRAKGGDAVEITEEHRSLAFGAWCRRQFGVALAQPEIDACNLLRFNPSASELVCPLLPTSAYRDLRDTFVRTNASRRSQIRLEKRTLSTIQPTAGGYLIPPETLIRNLEINLLYYGGVRQAADAIRTTTGERMSWPTADDTTNAGVMLGETSTIGTSVDPAFTKIYFDAYKFSSQPVLVPYELIQDTGGVFDLPNLLGELLGVRIGRATNTKYTLGTGAAQPKGIVTAAALGKTTASPTAILINELLATVHSIDPAYRYMPGTGWMFHDNVFLALRQLQDTNGRPIWEPNLSADIGQAEMSKLWGYPYVINQDMAPAVSNSAIVALFGVLTKYKIRTVGQVRMYRLQERYRDNDEDGFIAFLREDGNLLDAGAHPVKYLQMHG